MTSTESVIPSAAQHAKDYDLFNLVQAQSEFIPCSEIHEPFRVRINALEGPAIRANGGTDYEVHVSLAAHGREMTAPIQTAHSTGGKIEEWVFFPLQYNELPLDALVCCTVMAPCDVVVGSCTFHVFTSRGAAKRGPRRYALTPGVPADPHEDTQTLGHTETSEWQHLSRDFRQNRMPTAPWLDALATTRIRKLDADGTIGTEHAGRRLKASVASSSASLVPSAPRLEQSFAFIGAGVANPIAFDTSVASFTAAGSFMVDGAATAEDDGAAASAADVAMFLSVELPVTSTGLPLYRTTYSHQMPPLTADTRRRAGQATHPWATDATPFAPFPDLALGADNLCEMKAVLLAKSTSNALDDPDAKPSITERRVIERMSQLPPIAAEGAGITAEQSGLLWRFRHYCSSDPKLFGPFLACVDWKVAKEEAMATAVLKKWKQIGVADALALLATSVKPLREHAIGILAPESDTTLVLLLLQLVQALRFDTPEDELFRFLMDRAGRCWRLCSFMFWYLSVEADLEERKAGTLSKGTQALLSSTRIGFVKVSAETFGERRLRLLAHLEEKAPVFHRRIFGQQQLRVVLTRLYSSLKEEKTIKAKVDLATQLVKDGKCGIDELFDDGEVIYMPSHPHLAVKGISHNGIYVFKSAKMPIKLNFILSHESQIAEDSTLAHLQTMTPSVGPEAFGSTSVANLALGTDEASGLNIPSPRARAASTLGSASQSIANPDTTRSGTFDSTVSVLNLAPPSQAVVAVPMDTNLALMFKCGDDVRQDQLVIQFIELMDTLLKQNGLNLHMTPYRALATSQMDGFVELVPDCQTFQSIQRETTTKYLRRLHPTQAGFDRALDKFVKSTAGYCVITFILGIGDRHLENLLVTGDGRLFHVDFGYFMGKDPKPFPPPMKLNKEMVDTMGGPNGKQYRNFKMYCCSAFNILRKNSHLLLNLLLLMSDASIPNLDDDGKVDSRIIIMRVQDKLRLDLNDAEASQYLQGVINDSIGARFTNLWDVIHEVAQDVRN
jgi:phosphatidylinositol 3-kinase